MKTRSIPTIIMAAGGTGGHMFPAISLAASLGTKKFNIIFFTDRRKKTSLSFPENCPIVSFPIRRIGGKNPFKILYSGVMMLWVIFLVWRAMRRLRPDLVIGFGSYASLPTMLVAGCIKTKRILHEQNALLGRANRLLASTVDYIALTFRQTDGVEALPDEAKIWTGNPVRQSFIEKASQKWSPPEANAMIRLLVVGGSQGATIMGETVPEALAQLPASMRKNIVLVQQIRKEQESDIGNYYKKLGLKSVRLVPFIEDMAEQLALCHLVIARSGASSLAEITAIGRPSILVPYPHAMDDHQTANAVRISDMGAGWLIPQHAFTAENLSKKLTTLFENPKMLAHAAESAKKMGTLHASQNLSRYVQEMVKRDS